jgi:hypothetical protein
MKKISLIVAAVACRWPEFLRAVRRMVVTNVPRIESSSGGRLSQCEVMRGLLPAEKSTGVEILLCDACGCVSAYRGERIFSRRHRKSSGLIPAEKQTVR